MNWKFTLPSLGIWLVAAALLSGCVPRKARTAVPEFHPGTFRRVAVLPFQNQSTDLTGPGMLRRMVHERLAGAGWTLAPMNEVDAGLQDLGITDGGQLSAVSHAELGRRLDVDALVYGDVEEFSFQNVGIYLKREVRLRLKLFRAQDGTKLWEDVGSAKKSDVNLNRRQAGQAFVRGLATKAAENLKGTTLREESSRVVQHLVHELTGL